MWVMDESLQNITIWISTRCHSNGT